MKACRQIFRTHQPCCHDHLLSLDVHLVCRLVLHPELHLVHQHRQSRRQHLLDEVHQIRLDDLRLVVDHQIRLDDLRLDDLVHLDEHQLVEVLPLHRHQDVVLHCRMRMDCFQREVGAVLK